MIYLDAAASTQIDSRVKEDIINSLNNDVDWFNPSAIYEPSREVKRKIEYSKDQVRHLINADQKDDIIFCSCGSEANNLAIKGFVEANIDKHPLIITDMVSHPSVYKLTEQYYDKQRTEFPDVIFCDLDKYGCMDLDDLEYIFENINYSDYTILVATTLVNNETGVKNNIRDISEITHKYGGYVFADLSQCIYHMSVSIDYYKLDLATFTSEKMGMPRGCAVLYKKEGINIASQIQGGTQENGYRAGTENTMMIIPFGNQCERIENELLSYRKIERKLYTDLMNEIYHACENICDWDNNFIVNTVSNIVSIQFKGIDNQKLITMLDQYGVCCSAGSACSSGNKEPSRILKRSGLSDEEALSTVRFSFDHTLTKEDIKEFGKILKKCLLFLKDTK